MVPEELSVGVGVSRNGRPRAPTITIDVFTVDNTSHSDHVTDSSSVAIDHQRIEYNRECLQGSVAVLLTEQYHDDFSDMQALEPTRESFMDDGRNENPFAFNPGQMNKLLNPKSLAAFHMLGGLGGLDRGLKIDQGAGLSFDEEHLEFDSISTPSNVRHHVESTEGTNFGRGNVLSCNNTDDQMPIENIVKIVVYLSLSLMLALLLGERVEGYLARVIPISDFSVRKLKAGSQHLPLMLVATLGAAASAASMNKKHKHSRRTSFKFLSTMFFLGHVPVAFATEPTSWPVLNRHWTLSYVSMVSGAAMFGLAMGFFIAQNHTREGLTVQARASIFAAWLVSCAVFLPVTLAKFRLLGPTSLLAIAALVAGAPCVVAMMSDSARVADTILEFGTCIIFGCVLTSTLVKECLTCLSPRLKRAIVALVLPTNQHDS